jgi:hypothetical protein
VTFLRPGEYQQLRADGRCVECRGQMLPEWPQTARCPDCVERLKPTITRYTSSRKGRAAKRRYYQTDEAIAARRRWVRARDLKRKASGLCKDCGKPALDDSVYCDKHRELHRASSRDYIRRKRAAEAEGRPMVKKPKGSRTRSPRLPTIRFRRRKSEPVHRMPSADPVGDYRLGDLSLSKAAVRYVELHNGITMHEVGDGFGADARERNAITSALRRAAASGRLTVEGSGTDRIFYPIRARRAA